MKDWFFAPPSTLLLTVAAVFVIFTVTLIFVRIAGLRTFAKMSSIDFATTIAIGSILASVSLSGSTPVLQGMVALAAVIFYQYLFGHLKLRSNAFEDAAENNPTLLMRDGEFLPENMENTGVTRSDIVAKLREANVIRMRQVRAVVLETTGDISVLHASDDTELESSLLEGVVR